MAVTGSTSHVVKMTAAADDYTPAGGVFVSHIAWIGTTGTVAGDDCVIRESSSTASAEVFRATATGANHESRQPLGIPLDGLYVATLDDGVINVIKQSGGPDNS